MAIGVAATAAECVVANPVTGTMATAELAAVAERSRFAFRMAPGTWLVTLLVIAVGWLIVPPLAILLYGSVTDTPPAVAPHFTFDTLHYAAAGRVE